MRIGGKTVFVHRHRQRFLWKLDWVIMNEVAFCPNPYFLIHGGVVTRGGCAVLLHGSKGVGKTTLILSLVLRGWQYLSDDISAIHPESLLVVPFPRNFSVGKDVRALFGLAPAGDEDEDQIRPRKPLPRYANIARLWEGSLAAPSPVTHIVFPQYRPDAESLDTPVPAIVFMMRLPCRHDSPSHCRAASSDRVSW